ncbi:hypothetical protein ABPG74_019222 [Tetrahymena malaccensis]
MQKLIALLVVCSLLVSFVESKKKIRQNNNPQDANGMNETVLQGPQNLNSTQGIDNLALRIVSDPNQVLALEPDQEPQQSSQQPVAIMYNNDPEFKPQLIQTNMDSSNGVNQFDSLQQECFRQCQRIGGYVFYQYKYKNFFCCQFALNDNYDGTFQQTCLTATLNC